MKNSYHHKNPEQRTSMVPRIIKLQMKKKEQKMPFNFNISVREKISRAALRDSVELPHLQKDYWFIFLIIYDHIMIINFHWRESGGSSSHFLPTRSSAKLQNSIALHKSQSKLSHPYIIFNMFQCKSTYLMNKHCLWLFLLYLHKLWRYVFQYVLK